METIVKNKHAEAHALIDGFLQRHKDRHGIYINTWEPISSMDRLKRARL